MFVKHPCAMAWPISAYELQADVCFGDQRHHIARMEMCNSVQRKLKHCICWCLQGTWPAEADPLLGCVLSRHTSGTAVVATCSLLQSESCQCSCWWFLEMVTSRCCLMRHLHILAVSSLHGAFTCAQPLKSAGLSTLCT